MVMELGHHLGYWHYVWSGVEALTVGWKVDSRVDREEIVHLPFGAVLGGEGGG